jgi:hypothetical protein
VDVWQVAHCHEIYSRVVQNSCVIRATLLRTLGNYSSRSSSLLNFPVPTSPFTSPSKLITLELNFQFICLPLCSSFSTCLNISIILKYHTLLYMYNDSYMKSFCSYVDNILFSLTCLAQIMGKSRFYLSSVYALFLCPWSPALLCVAHDAGHKWWSINFALALKFTKVQIPPYATTVLVFLLFIILV